MHLNCVWMHIDICLVKNVCINIYHEMCIHIFVNVGIYVYICIYICTYIYIYMYIYTYIYIYIYIYIYVYIRIHVYMDLDVHAPIQGRHAAARSRANLPSCARQAHVHSSAGCSRGRRGMRHRQTLTCVAVCVAVRCSALQQLGRCGVHRRQILRSC